MEPRSPIICSKFDPSGLYLATGLIELDSHRILIQPVNPTDATSSISFKLDSSKRVSNLAWINYGDGQLVALCLTNGSILVYSTVLNDIVATLDTPFKTEVTDFHYSLKTNSGWSCDIGGYVYEWDLSSYRLLSHFSLNALLDTSESISRITTTNFNGTPHLLVCTQSIYLIRLADRQIIKTFPGHIQQVSHIIPTPSNEDMFLTCSKGDRFVNLYSINKNSNISVFSSSSSVSDIVLGESNNIATLVVIDENGSLEVFNDIFSTEPQIPNHNKGISKRRRKQQSNVQTKFHDGVIRLSRPKQEIKTPSDHSMPVNAAIMNGSSMIFSWIENSSIPVFESIKWMSESRESLVVGDLLIEKSRPAVKGTEHSSDGHDIAAIKHYNEGNAIVGDGNNFRDLIEEVDDETLAEKLDKLSTEEKLTTRKGNKATIDKKSTTTLSIVLSQALKNNDHSLLESVISNKEPEIIQNTILKLDASLAVTLLDRLAERIQRQNNKFDQLNYWLKWIIIIHGGVLASLPNLNMKLASLHSILTKKADTLPRLLELQGRLQMLYEQNELKKEIMRNGYAQEKEEIDSDIEYIEELDDASYLENEDDVFMQDGADDYVESDLEGSGSEEKEASDEDSDNDVGLDDIKDLEAQDVDSEDNYSDLEAV